MNDQGSFQVHKKFRQPLVSWEDLKGNKNPKRQRGANVTFTMANFDFLDRGRFGEWAALDSRQPSSSAYSYSRQGLVLAARLLHVLRYDNMMSQQLLQGLC